MARIKLILSKLPYLKKDILWTGVLIAILLIVRGTSFSLYGVNNFLFVIFALLAWRTKNKLDKDTKFVLSIGRIISLGAVIAILIGYILLFFPIFQPAYRGYVSYLLFHYLLLNPRNLFPIFGLIVYSLQYYIFTLWTVKFDFKAQKKLILLEFAGLILFFIIFLNISHLPK